MKTRCRKCGRKTPKLLGKQCSYCVHVATSFDRNSAKVDGVKNRPRVFRLVNGILKRVAS